MRAHSATSDAVISLFSGAGGFSYGFAQAGLKPQFGAELNSDACATYETNLARTCHAVDLSSVDPNFFKTVLGSRKPFMVIGGPPCQGFSTAGQRQALDSRNKLIFNYLNIVRTIRPRWFIFENVEGLLTSGGGEALSSLIREFLHIDYSVRVQKVNLAAFGVPQTRKRVLIIGNRLGIDFQFPEEVYSYDSGKSKKKNGKPFSPTFEEALRGLGNPTNVRGERVAYATASPLGGFDASMREGNLSNSVSEHFSNVSAKDAERYALLAPGQTMKDLPAEHQHESFKRRAFRRVQDGTPTEKRGGAPSGIKRLHPHLQSLTITGAASREFIHPEKDRPLTLRECARIQTFPDNYEFIGNAASVAQQIGNAVPPFAARAFARHIAALDGKFGADIGWKPRVVTPRLLGFHLTEADGMSEALRRTEDLLLNLQHPQLALE